jgi:Tol biopolymer transport system component
MDPVWSPDGERLLFTTTRLGSYEICKADPSGARSVKPLNTHAGDVVSCALTADHKTLVLQVSGEQIGEDILRYDPISGEYSITTEGDRMIVGLLDQPVRAEIEVVLDGFAALGVH